MSDITLIQTIRYEIMNADLVEYVHYLVFETSMKNEDIAKKLDLSLKELEYVAFRRKVKAYNFSYLKQVSGGDWVFDTNFAKNLIIGRNSLPMDTSPVQVGYSAMDFIQPDWLPFEIDGEIYHIEIDVDEGVKLSIWDWDKEYNQIGEQINDGWRIDNHDKKEFA